MGNYHDWEVHDGSLGPVATYRSYCTTDTIEITDDRTGLWVELDREDVQTLTIPNAILADLLRRAGWKVEEPKI